MTLTDWPADPAQLRTEVHAMRDALITALDTRLPAGDVRGLYFKGSGSKAWHAPCDYVPELSDLDLHIWLRDDVAERFEVLFRDPVFALEFSADAEQRFLERARHPLHWPRPQVLILNEAMRFHPVWHRSHVTVLRGEAYPGADPRAEEDREILLRVSAEAAGLGLSFMDKLGPQLWSVLRSLSHRVSPLPARLLSALGAGAWVWHAPRSELLAELDARDLGRVATEVRAYYDLAWQAFGSGWRDAPAMRRSARHALDALRLAAECARTLP